MRRFFHEYRPNPRQVVMMAVTLMAIVGAWAMQRLVFPAYDELALAREDHYRLKTEYARLRSNLTIRPQVNEAFSHLSETVLQTKSDQITMSHLLLNLEKILSRYSGLRMVNVKPLAVLDEGTHREYRVRLTAAGKLQELLRFVDELMDDQESTGLEGFSLRSVHGLNQVECSLRLLAIRLPDSRTKARGTEEEVGHAE